jgi:hypothetical protein
MRAGFKAKPRSQGNHPLEARQAMKKGRQQTTNMKHVLDCILAVSLLALVVLTSGCATVGGQIREPYTYSSETYNASGVSPATEQGLLDFLAQDATDKNSWIEGVYECGHFAADLWWNAYAQGLEACMVWVTHWQQGTEQVHWVVKFRIENEAQNYWLWVEPSSDEVIDERDFAIQDTFCGGEAFSLCKAWWQGNLS